MWCLSMNFRGIDRSELIPRLHHWFWPKISWTSISAKQKVESTAFIRRQGDKVVKRLHSVSHYRQHCVDVHSLRRFTQLFAMSVSDPIYTSKSTSISIWFMGYWCSGNGCILEGKDHRIDPLQRRGAFEGPPLRQRYSFNFLAGFYFKLATTRIARPDRVFYWHLECIASFF